MSDQLAHRQIEELLGAFALDAVDADERDLVEAHLAGCPRCRAEVAAHRETAALLAHTGTRAPEGVWERIAESIEDDAPPELQLAPVTPPAEGTKRRGRRSITMRTATVMTAVAAACAAFLGVQIGLRDGDLGDLRRDVSEDRLLRAALAAMGDPDAESLALQSFDGDQGARVVRLPDGTGYIVAEDLAPLPADRTYQLWGLNGDAKVSLAVLGHDPDVASFTMVGPVTGFAVTDEPAGGVVATEASPVVVGWIDPPDDGEGAGPAAST